MLQESIHESQSVATISETIGEGSEAHRLVRVGDWELKAWAKDEEPRIRDLDLAERLQYERPRKIRELIKRYADSDDLPALLRRSTVGRRGFVEESIEEFWLSEEEALFIATRSDTKAAIALTKEMIHVYALARRGLFPQQATGMSRQEIEQVVQAVLAPVADALRMVQQYAEHPDRFVPRGELRDHPAQCAECRALIGRAAEIEGVHWNTVQGRLLRVYQVRSYKRLPWTLWESARALIMSGIRNPTETQPRLVETDQLRLFHQAG